MRKNYTLDEENRIILTKDFPLEEEEPIFDFADDFDFEQQMNYKLVNGELIYDEYVNVPSPSEQIELLKGKLSETDYVVIKIVEGVATREQYAETISQRETWRTQINSLEAQL